METNKFNVRELSLSEQTQLNGGFFGIDDAIVAAALSCIAVLGAVIYVYNNKEDFVEGFKEGFNSVHNSNN